MYFLQLKHASASVLSLVCFHLTIYSLYYFDLRFHLKPNITVMLNDIPYVYIYIFYSQEIDDLAALEPGKLSMFHCQLKISIFPPYLTN